MLSIAIGSRLGVRVCTLGSLVAAAMIAAATPGGAAPQLNPDVGGAWSDPHDWTGQIGTTMCDPPPDEKEFSHAALLPKGPHAGKVLIWRKQMVMTGMDCDQTVNTTKVFLVDPNDPDTLITINQQLDSSIFCSGTSWQPNGNLLVVGGIRRRPVNPSPASATR